MSAGPKIPKGGGSRNVNLETLPYPRGGVLAYIPYISHIP